MFISQSCWLLCQNVLGTPKVYFDGGLHKFGFVYYSADITLDRAYGAYDPMELQKNDTSELQTLLASIRYLASEVGVTRLAS